MFKPLSKSQIKKLNRELSKDIEADIIFVLQSVEDPVNVGSLFRIADAVGAQVVLTGKTPYPPAKGIGITSMGLDRSVVWDYQQDFDRTIQELKDKEYEIVGVELTEKAIAYDKYDYKKKVCLVLGNEKIGIFKKNLGLLDSTVYIPMLGKGPSLNVNVAAAIVSYEILSKL